MVKVGRADIEAGRVREGVAWLERAAATGHGSAAYEVGRRKLEGDGIEQDIPGGLALIQKAAEQGHGGAMYALGKLYRDGTAVPQDKAMARTWFERAQAAGCGGRSAGEALSLCVREGTYAHPSGRGCRAAAPDSCRRPGA